MEFVQKGPKKAKDQAPFGDVNTILRSDLILKNIQKMFCYKSWLLGQCPQILTQNML